MEEGIMSKKYTTDELKQYIRTYLINRYIEFFKNLIVNYEPNHIIPGDAFDDLVRYKYQMSTLDLVTIKKQIDHGKATDDQRALYFKLQRIKDYTLEQNASIQKSIKLIEDYHEKIGTPFGGILFHIYAYLVFDISAATDNYNFADIVSYMYTHDQDTRQRVVDKIPHRRFRKTSQLKNNQIKKRWVKKAIDSGMILDKRQITHHWLRKPLQNMSSEELKRHGYIQ